MRQKPPSYLFRTTKLLDLEKNEEIIDCSPSFANRTMRPREEKGLLNIILLINDRARLESNLLISHPAFFPCYCLFCEAQHLLINSSEDMKL